MHRKPWRNASAGPKATHWRSPPEPDFGRRKCQVRGEDWYALRCMLHYTTLVARFRGRLSRGV